MPSRAPQVQRATPAEEKALSPRVLEAREALAAARQEERTFQRLVLRKDEEERQDRLSLPPEASRSVPFECSGGASELEICSRKRTGCERLLHAPIKTAFPRM